jgi:hypothetical protein
MSMQYTLASRKGDMRKMIGGIWKIKELRFKLRIDGLKMKLKSHLWTSEPHSQAYQYTREDDDAASVQSRQESSCEPWAPFALRT